MSQIEMIQNAMVWGYIFGMVFGGVGLAIGYGKSMFLDAGRG